MTRSRFLLGSLILGVLFLAACKDATLSPELTGSIHGRVLNFENKEAIAGASVTTSPPTDAIVADAQGNFKFDNIDVGNYTITANHPDFAKNTATVSVRENRTAEATVFLSVAEEADRPAMSVEITNWSTRISGDSTYVNVGYRVRNIGQINIPSYEVYFRMKAPSQDYLYEVRGTNLGVGQSDIEQFERYTAKEAVTAVLIDDYWFQGQDD